MRRACGLALVTILVGCGAARPTLSRDVGDYDTIVLALRARGASVQLAGLAAQPFMPVAAQVLSVDGASVQIFELDDEPGALAQAARIAPDASRVGGTPLEWPAPPHFYRAGRAIVLYMGDDPHVLSHLGQVLGDPIAIGRASAKARARYLEPAPTTDV